MEKIGISINLANTKNKINPLFSSLKVISSFVDLRIAFIPVIGGAYIIYKAIKYLIKKFENNYIDYLNNLKEEINNEMEYYFSYYNDKMQKYECLINDDINKFLGLIKRSNIQEDDNYNEAKENYLKIFEDYKKMNIIFDIQKP